MAMHYRGLKTFNTGWVYESGKNRVNLPVQDIDKSPAEIMAGTTANENDKLYYVQPEKKNSRFRVVVKRAFRFDSGSWKVSSV